MTPGQLVQGQRATISGNQDNRRVDMADKVLLLEPDAAPLTQITKNIRKRATGNPKFSWQEDELDPRFDAINNGAGYGSGATQVVVDNAAYFEPNQVVYVPRTGEQMLVTGVDTTLNRLTVTRGVGSTAAARVDNDELLIANTAHPEGDLPPEARTRNPVSVSNYTQILRNTVSMSNTAMNSEYEADDDWDYQTLKKGIEHRKSIEYAFMVGRPSETNTSGSVKRTTGGFKHFVSSNITDAGGTFTETEFFTALRPCFRYGRKEKWGLCSPLVVDVLNSFPRGKMQFLQSDKTFGLRIVQYISPHGTLNVATHWLLEGTTLGGQMWIVDTDTMAYRFMKSGKGGQRDTHINEHVEQNGTDGRQDEWLTEAGLQFGLEKRHGIVYNITG
jgi:hypothetical protein